MRSTNAINLNLKLLPITAAVMTNAGRIWKDRRKAVKRALPAADRPLPVKLGEHVSILALYVYDT